MLTDILCRHLVTLFLILLFSIRLWTRKSFQNMATRYFWLTVISCLLLVLEDVLEVIASEDPSLRFFRILISVFGYTFRSTAAIGLLLVIVPQRKRSFLLWLPCLITLLVSCTAFFSDVAFGYDEQYHFYRGPLGYVAFIVPFFYQLLILWITFRRFKASQDTTRLIIPVCVLFCISASTLDAYYGGVRINEAIMISSTFFYIFLYSHDNRHDTLTGLLNSQAFYDDCIEFNRRIGAVASLDMNGLKKLNDVHGHHAGDEALAAIGECLGAVMDQWTSAYRIGGDEFAILFFHDDEARIAGAEAQVRKSVTRRGYSVSAGYAMRGRDADLEEAIRQSDSRMYEDKANYYRANTHDRRRRA